MYTGGKWKKPLILIGGFAVVVGFILFVWRHPVSPSNSKSKSSSNTTNQSARLPQATYTPDTTTIDPAVSQNFSVDEIQNIAAMEKAYGFTFTPAEKKLLSEQKFIIKNLLDTSIRPSSGVNNANSDREFVDLYNTLHGSGDYKNRGQENSLYISSDVLLNQYSILFTELLKETENSVLYPAVKLMLKDLYTSAQKKLSTAGNAADRQTWTKVRNYLAVPYAIFSTAAQPLSNQSYYDASGALQNPDQVLADWQKQDAKVDTFDNVKKFVQKLKLDTVSQQAVLDDLKYVYDANDKHIPNVFKSEYEAYAQQEQVQFQVDFSQFTPRSTYTTSSLRRQYFRGMSWLIHTAFFLKSTALTDDAFALSSLLAANPAQVKNYTQLESLITLLVGTSDDLNPVDYTQAWTGAIGKPDQRAAAVATLTKAKDPKIKAIAALYPDIGTKQSSDVLLATKGLRFFSGKFILDSYWTGQLTQGDEAPRPGFTQKLPPMASSLEVMSLLGSNYATSQIPKLPFYSSANSQAIGQMLTQLRQEQTTFDDAYWQQSTYSTALWTIKSMFGWFQTNNAKLPRYMQSSLWAAKTLMSATGFWTELRHATLLYAKQSFAERGGGPGECDSRQVPAAPKGYIEPQPEAYAKLDYLARKTVNVYEGQSIQLTNLDHLKSYLDLLSLVRNYTTKELAYTTLAENVADHTAPDDLDPTKTCTTHDIVGTSDWENIRIKMVSLMNDALPEPVEGPVLPAKDKRAALVADVHTGGDSANPPAILYEGIGVPRLIFVAVKDANGPRLTVGLTYSQYEFTQPYGGQRLTDEDWQKKFYSGDDPYQAFQYTDKKNWPEQNYWYQALLRGK